MKTILWLSLFCIPFPAISHAYMSHDEIVSNFNKNSPGKAPQMDSRHAPKPKYNTLDQVLPNRHKKKKHHRKAHYGKKGVSK